MVSTELVILLAQKKTPSHSQFRKCVILMFPLKNCQKGTLLSYIIHTSEMSIWFFFDDSPAIIYGEVDKLASHLTQIDWLNDWLVHSPICPIIPPIYQHHIIIKVGKIIINHPPVITIFIGGINEPFPVMAGLWHCFTTTMIISSLYQHYIILISPSYPHPYDHHKIIISPSSYHHYITIHITIISSLCHHCITILLVIYHLVI